MTPQYQFNLGQYDPYLPTQQPDPDVYIQNVEQELQRLNAIKQQFVGIQNKRGNTVQQQVNNWDEVDKEIASLTDEQKQILAQDQTYISIEQELQIMIQQELINSVKDRVAASPRGKELLEAQLKNIKDKKVQIAAKSSQEVELFRKFQAAVQANPNLTYAEFVKSIKE